mmetsp:Transcript_24232/g.43686  ORF Transcript_24232/g.43686 Transcript_24232/m.43686 type:complete len:213 (+) Transcript_24232:395-1033(+)
MSMESQRGRSPPGHARLRSKLCSIGVVGNVRIAIQRRDPRYALRRAFQQIRIRPNVHPSNGRIRSRPSERQRSTHQRIPVAHLRPPKEKCNSLRPAQTERPRGPAGHGNGEVEYESAAFSIPRGARVVSPRLEFEVDRGGGADRGAVVGNVLYVVRRRVRGVFLSGGAVAGIHRRVELVGAGLPLVSSGERVGRRGGSSRVLFGPPRFESRE